MGHSAPAAQKKASSNGLTFGYTYPLAKEKVQAGSPLSLPFKNAEEERFFPFKKAAFKKAEEERFHPFKKAEEERFFPFKKAEAEGWNIVYSRPLKKAEAEGWNIGYSRPLKKAEAEGWNIGYSRPLKKAEAEGWNIGYSRPLKKAEAEGWNIGYSRPLKKAQAESPLSFPFKKAEVENLLDLLKGFRESPANAEQVDQIPSDGKGEEADEQFRSLLRSLYGGRK